MGQDGVNWAKQLPLYHRILNNDPQGVIAYKTPFEIYFARLRLNLPSAYSIGEKNYIRFRGKPSNKRHVTEGCIVKRKVKLHTYRVHTPHRFQERKSGNGSLWTMSQALH